jgi:hypothetical protein
MEDDGDILDEHHDAEDPEDERHGAQDVISGGLAGEDVGEDVQRGRACMCAMPETEIALLLKRGLSKMNGRSKGPSGSEGVGEV